MRPFRSRDPGIVGVALTRQRHLRPDHRRRAPPRRRDRAPRSGLRRPGALRSSPTRRPARTQLRLVSARRRADRGRRRRAVREDGVLAGTVLTMLDAVRNLHALGIPFEEAITAATSVPARILGRDDLGVLEPGGARRRRRARRPAGDRPRALRRRGPCRGLRPSCASSRARSRGCSTGSARRAVTSRTLFARDDVRYVLIASRGTSSNAARYAQYLLGRAHRVPVMFATPSLYTIYEQPPRLDGARRHRHLAVGRLAGRRLRPRRGAAARAADGRDHE